MQAVILSILLAFSPCNNDFITTGQSCYAVSNVLKNDLVQGKISKVYVSGGMFNVNRLVKVALMDTGILTIDKSGQLTFAPYQKFKGSFTIRYFVNQDWAYVQLRVVQMDPFPDENNYCYVVTTGNIQKYYLLVRKTYRNEVSYYYDAGALLFPLPKAEWRIWYLKKITMP